MVKMKLFKKIIFLIFSVIIIFILINFRISSFSKKYLYNEIKNIPVNKTGLLLGTSKYLITGNINPYFKYRINAAEKLYKNGKIKYIIASGDNRAKSYNEPVQMRKELLKRGIPKEAILLDFAGFRTLDSIIRCFKIFQQKSFTIISQKFHNERGVYIARYYDIDAIGFNAKDVIGTQGFKIKIREFFAKVIAMSDLYILKKQPKFLGEQIEID
jgi:SanA protein